MIEATSNYACTGNILHLNYIHYLFVCCSYNQDQQQYPPEPPQPKSLPVRIVINNNNFNHSNKSNINSNKFIRNQISLNNH